MDIKKFITDSRAVSPVIGVILMVAITVILAAVIGTFVLGLGNQAGETAPNLAFDFDEKKGTVRTVGGADLTDAFNTKVPADQDNITVTITIESGQAIDASNLNVTVNGEQAWGVVVDGTTTVTRYPFQSGDVSAGTSSTIALYGNAVVNNSSVEGTFGANENELQEGDIIRVVWTSNSGQTSSVLTKYTI